jgi:hypothetical protein
MKKLVLLSIIAACLTACIQTPTELQSTVDNRPQLTFAAAGDAAQYRVYVDNLAMGSASDFPAGKKALRLLSGTHVLRVEKAGKVILDEKIYLGDGTSKNIILNQE